MNILSAIVSPQQAQILKAVIDGRDRQADLPGYLGLPEGSVGRNIAQLREAGWLVASVERDRDIKGKPSNILRLSADGKRKLQMFLSNGQEQITDIGERVG